MKRLFQVITFILLCILFTSTESIATQPHPKEKTATTPNSTDAVSTPPVASQSHAVDQSDINEQNTLSDAKAIPSASDNMDDWADSVLQHFHIDRFGENNGKFVLYASESVSLKPTDPQYGDALVNAFDKAMMKLQGKYLIDRFGEISTQKIRSFFSDTSTHAKEIEFPHAEDPGYIGKLLSVLNKSLDVTDKKLDKKLIELGVDPATVAKATPKIKKDLFRDKFIKSTLTQASGSIAGLFPIQTNVISDKKGRTSIGVVAVASPKTIQIAKDITLQRQSLIRGKGRDLDALLPREKQEYIGTLGVRLAYDQDGTPAILSYGIASYMPDSGDDYVNDELKSDAKDTARSNANAQIAEIINGRMNTRQQKKQGEEIRKFVEREAKPDSDTIEKEIKNIIKITNRIAKSSAHARLQGISTLKTWRYTLPSGQKFVGAVRAWKYSTLHAVNSFNKSHATREGNHNGKKTYNRFQQSSKPVNTMDDF